jgi:hypothetical protein
MKNEKSKMPACDKHSLKMEAKYSSETSVGFNGLHGAIFQKIIFFTKNNCHAATGIFWPLS